MEPTCWYTLYLAVVGWLVGCVVVVVVVVSVVVWVVVVVVDGCGGGLVGQSNVTGGAVINGC